MALMPKKRRAARFTPKRSDDPPKSGGFLSGPPTTTYRLRLARRIGARRPGPELAEVMCNTKNYRHVTRHLTAKVQVNGLNCNTNWVRPSVVRDTFLIILKPTRI